MRRRERDSASPPAAVGSTERLRQLLHRSGLESDGEGDGAGGAGPPDSDDDDDDADADEDLDAMASGMQTRVPHALKPPMSSGRKHCCAACSARRARPGWPPALLHAYTLRRSMILLRSWCEAASCRLLAAYDDAVGMVCSSSRAQDRQAPAIQEGAPPSRIPHE